jgi:hypothetical protein
MVTADMLINQAKKEATAAAAAAKKVAKALGMDAVEVKTAIMTQEEAKREANKQNIANQTIVGTKVGLVEVMKRIIGGDILDIVTKIPDGRRDKSIPTSNYMKCSKWLLTTLYAQRSYWSW